MLGSILGLRRENDLVVFIAMHGYVGPIKHRLYEWRVIEHAHMRLDIRAVGANRKADNPLHPMAQLSFPDPDGCAAVVVFNKSVIHGKLG